MSRPTKRGVVINRNDNVVTLLTDVRDGDLISVSGASDEQTITARELVVAGHKVALSPIDLGSAIIKFGVSIGQATQSIGVGQWVHLHNCTSQMDERSGTLDRETGATIDTRYE